MGKSKLFKFVNLTLGSVTAEIRHTKDYKVKNRKNFIVTAEVTIDE